MLALGFSSGHFGSDHFNLFCYFFLLFLVGQGEGYGIKLDFYALTEFHLMPQIPSCGH